MIKFNVSKVTEKPEGGVKKPKTAPPKSKRSYQATIPTKKRKILENLHKTREIMHAKMRALRDISSGPEHEMLKTKIAELQNIEKKLQLLLQPAN